MVLTAQSKKWISDRFGKAAVFDEPMSRHTWFGIGGTADALVRPETRKDLGDLVQWCEKSRIPYFVMGSGSNLLVRDGGIRGVVIAVDGCLKKIRKNGERGNDIIVCAESGVTLQRLWKYALDNGMGGLNFALGIPGTVGGGIMMNAGTGLGDMASVIISITVLWPWGETEKLPGDRLDFSYRRLKVAKKHREGSASPMVLLDGDFKLHIADKEKLRMEADMLLKKRRETQPLEARSSGCFFKNPDSGPPAGLLIDQAGLKGKRINDACVSDRHANFILNQGNASATDVIRLMEHIQKIVSKKYDILLEPEVKIVGEDTAV
jgi:UDP-N-acetylmuramate dehydrogenase